jgi:hypothetical protein
MPEINIDLTDKLVELFKIPQGDRDAGWTHDFFKTVPNAALTLAEPEVQKGPDGFPYLQLLIPPEDGEFKGYSISHLLDVSIERGVGAVILPAAGANPFWVFSYGKLLSYKLLGNFDARPANPPPQPTPAGERQVMIAQPNENYLPSAARAIIKQYLELNGVSQPAMFMLHDASMSPPQQLVFNLFRENYPSDEHFHAVCQRLTWYLPPSYSFITLPNDKTQFQSSFAAL